MKAFYYSAIVVLISLLALSCEKTVTFDDTRKLDNEDQFAKITASADYKRLMSESGNGFIMYKVLKTGETERKPYFTDEVKVLYTGWYKRFWTKDDKYNDANGNPFQNKIIFDSTEDRNNIPSTFPVKGVVDGFATALQHMNVGDKWEIWIPWILGYGEYDYRAGGIPGYTTLVFDVELVDIIKK